MNELAVRAPDGLSVRVLIILGQAGVLAAIASSDGAIIAAVIAGAFTLINTALMIWLTGRDEPPRRRPRRRPPPPPCDEQE